MKKFLRDTKGAVTVFITLLLIPAMLVSGTAVDLARIHTAQSTIQNANQLAANTVLTQYKALLYDIYGLMGIAHDDPVLWKLLDEYIKVTIFGQEYQDRSLGTLQVFYGANISLEEPYFPDGKNLRNEEVLRRQIEEYMKFRGPVLLVQSLIKKLTANNILADAGIINEKMEIDSAIADMFEKYKELYNAIVAADRCTQVVGGIAGGSFGHMSSVLTSMHEEFVMLAFYMTAYAQTDAADVRAYYLALYRAGLRNIRALTIGGQRTGFHPDGTWGRVSNINVGLVTAIENAKTQADNFKPRFDAVVTIARELDSMKGELSKKLDDFEASLNSGEISEELRIAFTTPQGSPPQSILSRYRSMLRWDIEPMAVVFRNGGYNYIDGIHKPMLDKVRYRDRENGGRASLSVTELENIPNDGRFSIVGGITRQFSSIPRDNVTYKMEPGFLLFAEHGGRNAEFFAQLHAMMNQPPLPVVRLFNGQGAPKASNPEDEQRDLISELLGIINTAYNGLKNEPLGAKHINNAAAASSESVNFFEIVDLIPEAAKIPAISIIDDTLGTIANMGDYTLLLAYCSSMFSNYSVTKPDSVGKTRGDLDKINFEKTVSGVPMSPEVNYFYQSELEYLLNGSENASTNLSHVTRLLLLVRLVCNYIRVFSVPEVTAVVNSIKAAFAWAPPLAIILGELARAAFVAAESVVDVAALRTGHKVPLFKNIDLGEWVCTPSGILNALRNVAADGRVNSSLFTNSRGLTYLSYMLFFFLTRAVFYTGRDGTAANELAKRTGNLIEWNIVNFESGSNADEAAMTNALNAHGRFMLDGMKTDFSLTTAVDLRMLFLSMAFAQNFSSSRGIGVPPSMPLRATDYRGY